MVWCTLIGACCRAGRAASCACFVVIIPMCGGLKLERELRLNWRRAESGPYSGQTGAGGGIFGIIYFERGRKEGETGGGVVLGFFPRILWRREDDFMPQNRYPYAWLLLYRGSAATVSKGCDNIFFIWFEFDVSLIEFSDVTYVNSVCVEYYISRVVGYTTLEELAGIF